MAATGKEQLYVSTGGGGRSTVSAQEVADLAGGGGGAVTSVNSQIGEVVLDASDVGALPATAVASYVGNADDESLTTVAEAIDAIRDALVVAGLMAGDD